MFEWWEKLETGKILWLDGGEGERRQSGRRRSGETDGKTILVGEGGKNPAPAKRASSTREPT